MTESTTTKIKMFRGAVVSDKMAKTIVVLVEGYKKHPKYEKYVRTNKKYKAHDENGEAKVGDLVEIEVCRPISRDKKFRLTKILNK